MNNLKITDFKIKSYDKLRYGDTDRQGHINNSVFATFLETGRVEILISKDKSLYTNDHSFVIANLNLNFISEIHWPGIVEIGTAITKVGNSSITMLQNIYQNGNLVASGTSVLVQVANDTKKSSPLSNDAKNYLNKYLLEV